MQPQCSRAQLLGPTETKASLPAPSCLPNGILEQMMIPSRALADFGSQPQFLLQSSLH